MSSRGFVPSTAWQRAVCAAFALVLSPTWLVAATTATPHRPAHEPAGCEATVALAERTATHLE